ncbi:hypothetical protein AB0D60_01020 [Streptomyces sp. NPDC048306]|uniref:hypothetical protein n=1 Tax=Streptomyces sp. NPDC048306 TaxID=3154502 RepID=UPI00341163F9
MSDTVIVDIYAATLSTGLKPGTIRQWLHRGRLTHYGYDRQGRVLINLYELHTPGPRPQAPGRSQAA